MPLLESYLGKQFLRNDVTIVGASLGGMLAAYAGFEFDSTFSRVAALSPSYYWGNNFGFYVLTHPKPARLRRYFHATGEVQDNPIGLVTETMIGKGFVPFRDLHSLIIRGGSHNEGTWGRALDVALPWVLADPESLRPTPARGTRPRSAPRRSARVGGGRF